MLEPSSQPSARLPVLPDSRTWSGSLHRILPYTVTGSVRSIRGNCIIAQGFPAPVGAVARIQRAAGQSLEAEVIGFDAQQTILAPLDTMDGVSAGDPVELHQTFRSVHVCPELVGRVLDASGSPIDDGPSLPFGTRIACDSPPAAALSRPPIRKILPTQVRAIDSLLTVGQGQRLGIFAGSGVGKSTLLGMLARGTQADCVVIALVGERGREVREFLDHDLGEEGRAKSITVVATSDQAAPKRILAAKTATSIAESLRDQGKSVLLLMDSVTRFAMAQREIGLAAGEAPTTRGYPSSVFSMLPQLVERAGVTSRGSITAFYTVLVEGDDPNEPISDALRGLLDGHIHLSRTIAARNQYPAIDVLTSLSRLHTQLTDPQHRADAAQLRRWLAIYQESENLIQVGAYTRGTDPILDQAIELRPRIEAFLSQSQSERVTWEDACRELHDLVAQADSPDRVQSTLKSSEDALSTESVL
jgi:flagellum-specific ATP synthase